MNRLLICVFLFVLASSHSLTYGEIKTVKPERHGFSSERLARIAPVMQSYIDQDKLPGILTLVARDGKVVYLKTQGMKDREGKIPLTEDSIFRIYSMTKPVTAVAAMTLWEQGLFHMSDPIGKHLPELMDLKVYVSGTGEDMVLENAASPIRVIDLFLHTSGLSYGFSNSEVDKLYRQSPIFSGQLPQQELLKEIAKLPLSHHPGTAWTYGISTDVLGSLVEKLSGKTLAEYMQENIFTPLKMKDTDFYVPAEKRERFVKIYTSNNEGKTVFMENSPLGDYKSTPKSVSGGGGLVSTVEDYLKFTQMLLNGGEYKGTRILGRKTVEYLRSNHLPKNLIPYQANAGGEGYALAMSVTVDPDQVNFMSSKGNYGWGGMASTYFRIDPEENLIMISLSQFVPIGFHPYHDDFRNLVYQALVD